MKNIKLFKNSNVLYELVRKSIKAQYRGSWLGMFWTILNPLLNMLVMWAVFSQFFGKYDPLYPVYLITGNVLFSSLRSSTSSGLSSVVSNRGLLTRLSIPYHLFPIASVISSVINFFFSLISVFIIMIIVSINKGVQIFSPRILCIFVMLPPLMLFELGISLFLSAVFVYARDIKHLYNIFLVLWTYITPIFYKYESLSSNSFAAKIIRLNPMFYFLNFFRSAMYCGWNSNAFVDIGLLFGIGVASLAIGMLTFKLLKKNFMTNI